MENSEAGGPASDLLANNQDNVNSNITLTNTLIPSSPSPMGPPREFSTPILHHLPFYDIYQAEDDALTPPDRPPPKPPTLLKLPAVSSFCMPSSLAVGVEPAKAVFIDGGDISKHILTNHSGDRLALKVRCSNNAHFRVKPVYTFLECCGATTELEIIRLGEISSIRSSFLQLVYVVCRDDDVHFTELFNSRAKVRTLFIPITTF